jgi:hypothetical protein
MLHLCKGSTAKLLAELGHHLSNPADELRSLLREIGWFKSPEVALMRRRSNSLGLEVSNREAVGNEPGSQTARQRQTRLSSEQVDELVVAYERGSTLDQLAAKYVVDAGTAAKHLERRGVSRRGRKLTDQQIADAAELYEAGWSLSQIGERYGVYGQSVGYRLRKAGMQLRPRNGPSN